MKVNNLIYHLERLENLYGDIEVVFLTHLDPYTYIDIHDVKMSPYETKIELSDSIGVDDECQTR